MQATFPPHAVRKRCIRAPPRGVGVDLQAEPETCYCAHRSFALRVLYGVAGRYVADNGPAQLAAVAGAVGVSVRTMSRVLPYAVDQGYLRTAVGSGGGIGPGPAIDALAASAAPSR